MHVLLVAHSSTTAGAERTLVALAAAAARAGERVTISVPRRGPIDRLIAVEAPDATVRVQRCQWWMGREHHGVGGVLRTAQALAQTVPWVRLLRRERPDLVVVGSTVVPAPLLAARLLGIPRVVILGESIRSNPTLDSIVPKAVIVRALSAWSNVSVAVSEYVSAQYHRPTMIEYPPVALPGRTLRKDDPTAGDRSGMVAVALGTLSAEKGQTDLVETARLLYGRANPVRIDLYGDARPADLHDLRQRIAATGVSSVLRHCGPTDDPLGVLAAADVSLVCSRNEAYGRVTLESVLVGTPVIGYDLGGTREILRAGGGTLVEPTPSAVAAVLQKLADDMTALAALRSAAADRARSGDGVGDADGQWRRIRDAAAPIRRPGTAT